MYHAPPQSLPQSFRCGNHPDREGIGICVGCRSVVCVECSTKIDRMNYCIRCLQAAAPVERSRDDPRADTVAGIPLLIGSFALTAALFAVLGLLLAIVRNWNGGGVGG